VAAANDDEVLLSSRDVDLALVDESEIARTKHPLSVEAGDEGGAVLLLVAPVAGRDARAGDADLADRTGRQQFERFRPPDLDRPVQQPPRRDEAPPPGRGQHASVPQGFVVDVEHAGAGHALPTRDDQRALGEAIAWIGRPL